MARPIRWPLIALSGSPEPPYDEVGWALVEAPDTGEVLPVIFTERELAERWEALFAERGKEVVQVDLADAAATRAWASECHEAGFARAWVDPAPGRSGFLVQWDMKALLARLEG